MTTHLFTCSRCHKTKTHTDEHTTGYAEDRRGRKICFACCADVDREEMRRDGKILLYLTKRDDGRHVISNWPSTLEIPVRYLRKGAHNVARSRYDAWFTFEGREWYGVQYGDNTQLIRCRALKARAA